jgi:anionic cell wall polymer biosynthesis LytR-Cps2A-Psr (LCP) family protein
MQLQTLLRKPIAAAILSLVFPGLGQAAAGDRRRGAIVAIPALALVGVFLLILIFDRGELFGLALNQQWLTSLLIVDIVAFVYHAWAVVDSYLLAAKSPVGKVQSRRRPSRSARRGLAGMLGLVVVLSGAGLVHGSVAKVDMDWQRALYCLTAKIPCWVTDNPNGSDPNASAIADATDQGPQSQDSLGPGASATPMSTYDISKIPTFSTTSDSQRWDADGELNILLLGIGVENDPSKLGPDTIMVLHVGINTGQAELISIGRNNYCTPLPTQEIAANYAKPPYNCPAGTWGYLLNGLPNEILGHCDRWPIPEYKSTCGQSGDENRYLRAYKGFEMTIGYLLGLKVDGSMWINPIGMTTLIDALGGVDITVQTQLFDKPCGPVGTAQQKIGLKLNVPGNATCADTSHWGYFVPTGDSGVHHMKDLAAASGGGLAVYDVPGHSPDVAFAINAGTYHMNGDWALAYARTRIYDPPPYEYVRAGRQQILLASLRKSLDPCRFASLGNVVPLLTALQAIPYGFNTDMDITNPQNLKAWAGLAKSVLGDNVQRLVLEPQLVGMGKESYVSWDPNTTIPKARALVQQYFQKAPTASPGASGGSSGGGC